MKDITTGEKMPYTGGKDALLKDLEEALKALVKLMKAFRYYPPGHPSLKNAAKQTLDSFTPLLAGQDNLTLKVGKQGFFFDEIALAPENTLLQKLGPFLFARRIHRIMVLPDLSAHDLRAFVRCLALTPADIQKRGGFQEVLLKARVSTLWVNETDLARILARKEEIEAEKRSLSGRGAEEDEKEVFFAEGEEDPGMAGGEGAHTVPGRESSSGRSLEQVLGELETARNDQHFRLLLQELVPLVHLNLTKAYRNPVLRAMSLLCLNTSDRNRSMARREYALQALAQLTTDDVIDFLASILCSGELKTDTRRQVMQILLYLKDKVVRRLMDRLAVENNVQSRKFLAEALILQGPVATPILSEYLGDDRWYVVRNAVVILGEIRDPEAIAYLPPLLQNSDIRVRRETIRALTKFGGPKALVLLLRVLEGEDQELRRQALLSLGAMKNPTVVPILLRMVGRPDPWVKQADIKKSTIKALGEIGSMEAIPALHQILGRRKLWKRSQYDEIRAVAALALGDIGSDESVPFLEAAAEDSSETVARASVQALKLIKKGTDGT
jgi:HEAT repeat protein